MANQKNEIKKEEVQLNLGTVAKTVLVDLPLGIFVFDSLSGQCLFANQAGVAVIGADAQSVLAINFFKESSWKKSGMLTIAKKAIAEKTKQLLSVSFTSSFGKEIWADCEFIPFQESSHDYLLLTIHDVADYKAAIIEEEEKSGLLKTFLEAIPNPVFYKDLKGVYTDCNQAFLDYSGKKRTEVVGHTAYDVVIKEQADQHKKMDVELLSTGKGSVVESHIVTTNGQAYDIIINKAVIKNIHGEKIGIVGIISDVTKIRTAEQALNEKVEELERVNKLMVGRELKMVELKEEIARLKNLPQ
ncbi:MAG TPA: PAS domain S-box protein [bacterium]|nr:PAS domain S-box protein [bacterium]HPT29498.1 PAS domain S-box protein [bacterium]